MLTIQSEKWIVTKKKKLRMPLDKHQIVKGEHSSKTEIFTCRLKNHKTVNKLGEI